MSTWWAPKPIRPEVGGSSIFEMGDETYVKKASTPMQIQRERDGSPHTKLRPSSLSPKGETLYVKVDEPKQEVSKSETSDESVDPDAVVKSFMSKGYDPDDKEEDEEKGVGENVGNAVGSAVKTGTKAVASVAEGASNAG